MRLPAALRVIAVHAQAVLPARTDVEMPTIMLHQDLEKSKREKEDQQRFMGAIKTLGIAALLWQKGKQEARQQTQYV